MRLEELDRRIRSLTDLHLTHAEIRILPYLPTHFSVKEIAARRHVSPTTVKTHISSIYTKLDATTRSDAVAKMQQLGLHVKAVAREQSVRTFVPPVVGLRVGLADGDGDGDGDGDDE